MMRTKIKTSTEVNSVHAAHHLNTHRKNCLRPHQISPPDWSWMPPQFFCLTIASFCTPGPNFVLAETAIEAPASNFVNPATQRKGQNAKRVRCRSTASLLHVTTIWWHPVSPCQDEDLRPPPFSCLLQDVSTSTFLNVSDSFVYHKKVSTARPQRSLGTKPW